MAEESKTLTKEEMEEKIKSLEEENAKLKSDVDAVVKKFKNLSNLYNTIVEGILNS